MNLKELRYKISSQENLSGKLEKINGAGHKTNRMLGTQNTRLASFKKNISSAASELPFLSRGMGLLSNPITLTTAALGGIVLGLNKAKNAAAAFNTEFRALQNLNLDKSAAQIAGMKGRVFDTAFDNGFNAQQTSTAYYDVQSIAGIQGSKAESLITKTGEFSRVMQSDFQGTIAGTAQVMDIYGISVNRTDDYLNSMYKTVMVGKTTFDEMSKVQVEYASAAAAAGQDYDSANKIFAAFSKTQKSVSIASTMTKTAFQDLTKKATLDGLKQIGVNVFDAQGKMQGVDTILQNLIPKLSSMNDLDFAKLKEQIGGSEGIKGLLDLAKSSGTELLSSFELFDSSDMDYGKAIRAFHEDVNELNKTLKERTQVLLAEIGQDVLPAYNAMQRKNNAVLESVREVTSGDVSWFDQFMTKTAGVNVFGNAFGSQDRINKYHNNEAGDEYRNRVMAEEFSRNPNVKGLSEDDYQSRLDQLGKASQFYMAGVGSAKDKATGILMQSGMKAVAEVTKQFMADYMNRGSATAVIPEDGTGTIGGTSGTKIAAIGAGGTKTINITMTNDIDINSTGIEGTANDLAGAVEESFARVLQGVEEAYG